MNENSIVLNKFVDRSGDVDRQYCIPAIRELSGPEMADIIKRKRFEPVDLISGGEVLLVRLIDPM